MKSSRIIICRHAESLEDVNNDIYDKLNDLDIPLTSKGRRQSKDLGQALVKMLPENQNIRFFTSPGLRNRQTLEIILPYLPKEIEYSMKIEPLLVKQNWGHITSQNRPGIESERYKVGVLRYTFPTGESAESLIKRLNLFKDTMYKIQDEELCDIVILSHGFEFRVLLMLIMGWSEEYFESLENLHNSEFRVLTRLSSGIYELNEPLRFHHKPITRLL